MKTINNLLKSNKFSTTAKILIPVAGAIAVKHLWDKKGSAVLDNARSKVLDKTEDLQEKVQKFHDFVQNSLDEAAETVSAEESTEDNMEETISTEVVGEESDENNEENVEETEENNGEVVEEAGESPKESEIN